MAYRAIELEKKAVAAIKKYKLVFIQEVISYLPCSSSTFYEHELEKSETIKEEIEKNKVESKVGMRKKWSDSDNPTLQLALYKLLSTDEEFARLATNNIDHTSKGEKIDTVRVEVVSVTKPVTSEDDIDENI